MSGYNQRKPHNRSSGQNYHHGGSSQHAQGQQASRGQHQQSQPQAGGSRQQGATAGSHTSQSTSQSSYKPYPKGSYKELRLYGHGKGYDEEAQNFWKHLQESRRPTEDHDEYDDDDDFLKLLEEKPENCGFTDEQVNELLSYGVKPWDTEAHDFLDGLYAERRAYDRQNRRK